MNSSVALLFNRGHRSHATLAKALLEGVNFVCRKGQMALRSRSFVRYLESWDFLSLTNVGTSANTHHVSSKVIIFCADTGSHAVAHVAATALGIEEEQGKPQQPPPLSEC